MIRFLDGNNFEDSETWLRDKLRTLWAPRPADSIRHAWGFGEAIVGGEINKYKKKFPSYQNEKNIKITKGINIYIKRYWFKNYFSKYVKMILKTS